jgi:hypothetical protein
MKKQYLLLSVFVLCTLFSFSQSITIGAGTATSYFYGPYYRSTAGSTFNNSKYAYIYTPDELTAIPAGSIITSIEWEKSSGTITAPNIFQIYLENNSATTLTTGTSWGALIASGTSVYNNTNQGFTAAAPGWELFTLTTPFIYTGGTLQICTDHVKQGIASGANNYLYEAATGKAIGWASGTAGSNTTLLNTATYGSNRPNIRISYIPGTNCTGAPEAGTSTASSSSVCPSSTFSLSLSGATLAAGLTYQWQSSIDGITYSDITGATNSAFSTSQTSNTYYQCVVTCSASGQQDISTPIQVTTNSFLNCYCTSNATSTADEEILNVSLGTLNNTSTCSTTGGPGSILSQYSDYTTTVNPPILVASANYTLGIQIGTCGGNFGNMTKAFIDFNQNGQFTDPGEEIYVSPAAVTGPNTISATILITANAVAGLTRMRIVTVETTVATGVTPCGTYTWGETEDYLVQIVPPPTCPQPTNLSLATSDLTSATIQWTAGGTETQWQIEYGPTGFTPGTGTFLLTTTNPTTITGLIANSFYQAYVRGICTPGDSSYWAGTISWNTFDQGQYMDWDSECPTTGFIDISSTGTPINTTDDSELGITLPFPVLYQGALYTTCTIGNNGGIVFGSTTANVGYNMVAGNGLYPFVQDLNTANAGGGVYYEAIGNAPNRKFIVSWVDLPHFGGVATDGATFQLIIEEATMEIYFVYEDVQMSNTTWDNGADAEIGIRGTNQNIDVSLNNATYLQNNSCVHFSYTDCPKPKNFTMLFTGPIAANFSWTPSIANETNWTIIYGPQGFDPTTSGTTVTSTTPSLLVSNLTQLTNYDVYIYSDCSVGIQSDALIGTFFTPPFCSNPTNLVATSEIDSIITNWNWALSAPQFPITSFNIQYGQTGFDLYSNGTTEQLDNNLNDTLFNANFMAGGVYDVYVQAVCGSDTSQFVGPISVVMPLTNNDVCGAETIPVDGQNYIFNNTGATVAPNDLTIAPPATGANTTDGWINSTLNLTTWFKFTAPNSGDVRINCTDINYNGQVAVYNNSNCQTMNLSQLVGANDNEIGGNSVAPNFTICNLIPGNSYFILFDGFNSTTGNYSISLSEIILNAGSTGSQLDVCYSDTVNLFNGISGYDTGGVWSQQIPTLGLQDSLFITTGLASVVFNFTYTLTDGCSNDAVGATVKVFSPSSAGNDGTITVCKNEPFSLLNGLTGNVDIGGTWYNPQNQALASNIDTASNFPGQFNYDYIVSNGICPADTSNILMVVDPSCDYLAGIGELSSSILVYPNPTSNMLTLDFGTPISDVDFELFDIQGKAILGEKNISLVNGKHQVNTSILVPGVYMLHINSLEKQYIYRIIKD